MKARDREKERRGREQRRPWRAPPRVLGPGAESPRAVARVCDVRGVRTSSAALPSDSGREESGDSAERLPHAAPDFRPVSAGGAAPSPRPLALVASPPEGGTSSGLPPFPVPSGSGWLILAVPSCSRRRRLRRGTLRVFSRSGRRCCSPRVPAELASALGRAPSWRAPLRSPPSGRR